MVLEVRLYATLRRYAPNSLNGIISLTVPERITVLDLVKQLKMDPAEIHLIMINGLGREFDERLTDGDRVGLFPPVGGG
ncbi:molybdopterin converting factor small subunit [Sporomusaceae bacterium BoRhaA]|uniref:MoaD/ThiS family protein n=1 Tax=Pelorhabdus rhamnosifermentans TaxID=2772457 RepID=UPI001C0623BB|nr:MoaD/ThiS family protein [Pelorhabdus rhamnosifermentans]MBU2702429.1 molybdopterin converting factor small subunit [Pelorhabdus rhamnosifermentans]